MNAPNCRQRMWDTDTYTLFEEEIRRLESATRIHVIGLVLIRRRRHLPLPPLPFSRIKREFGGGLMMQIPYERSTKIASIDICNVTYDAESAVEYDAL
jgi:hypothetical protein